MAGDARAPIVVTVLLALAAPARADDPQAARLHFEQGTVLYTAGDYELALAEFQEAYRAKPHPTVLRNIAATQEALHRYGDALATLERYLVDATSRDLHAERAAVEAHLAALRNLVGRIVIEAPDGATLRVDGAAIGTAPRTEPFVIAHGQHVVEAALEGHDPAIVRVDVPARQDTRVELRPVPRMAHLTVDASAPHAMVSVDGGAAARAPWSGALLSGRHRLHVEAPGRRPTTVTVDLGPGAERSVVVPLEAGGPQGLLVVEAAPPRGARAFLDSRPFALGAVGALALERGMHRLVITGPGRVEYRRGISIQQNRMTHVRVDLADDRFWVPTAWGFVAAGATALLAGGAVFWGVRAVGAANEFQDAGTASDRLQGLWDDHEQFARAATFSAVAAAVSAAGTIVLFLFSRGAAPDSHATVEQRPIE